MLRSRANNAKDKKDEDEVLTAPPMSNHFESGHNIRTSHKPVSIGTYLFFLVSLIIVTAKVSSMVMLKKTLASRHNNNNMTRLFMYTADSSSTIIADEIEIIPLEIARSLDAILVLGGGVPSSICNPPEYVKSRCEAAARVFLSTLQSRSTSTATDDNEQTASSNSSPAVLCLSAGTAHLPQLLSSNGLPIWESTASAAYILNMYPYIPSSKIFAETTSYDTISNAFYSRTSFTDIVGWRRLLIVTNEFHMDRTREIFQWIFGAENTALQGSSHPYELYFLSCSNDGLSEEAIHARKEHEERGARNVKENLSKRYITLQDIWAFLTTDHDFYSAEKLAKKGTSEGAILSSNNNAALKNSYGATPDSNNAKPVE